MVPLQEKIAYALGDAASGGITWKIMSVAFPLFFTHVFGLSFADAAALMLVARIFDVFTDPLMGSIADRTKTRWGTYRPWLIFGAVPFGLIFALLLFTPDLGPTGKRVWAYTFYLLMMAVYTAVNVPYGSLLGVMTTDDNEKNQFSAFRMVGLMTLTCGLMTKERHQPVIAEKFSFKQFADLFCNKPWVYMTSIAFCTNFFNGFRYAVVGYMFTYCICGEFSLGRFILNYTAFMAFSEVTCMIFGALSPAFTRKVGSKRMAFVWASVICCVFSVLYFFIPMDASYLWLMVLVSMLASVGAGLYSPLLWSMYADVADYATEKNGTSSTGLIFSSGTMAQKFGGAISGSLIALLLGYAGLVSETDMVTGETIVSITNEESVRTMVWALFSLFPAAIACIMAYLAYKFPLKKSIYEK